MKDSRHSKSKTTQIKSLQINCVSEFISHVEAIKQSEQKNGNSADFIFRGQPVDKPLLPKLGRVVPKGHRANIEQLMFKEFQRTSISLSGLRPESDWGFLSYPVTGEVSPARIVVLNYKAENFPTEASIGTACLQLTVSGDGLDGFWAGLVSTNQASGKKVSELRAARLA